ncbi:MAG TPA: CDP-diacylglycerol--glycerol-3-phosphate 3-phosphatidyltransferase [Solirubrobacteraceae bacterium]|nr:CDP-diacylglycerol--glycerol-3-phosphate 3-phosphatidyltransferase [Solirubrobacteraceae bacterium]
MSTSTTSARGAGAARWIAAGTCVRIVLAPVIMALVLAGEDAELTAALLFVAVAATDFWDGWLARRWEITTTLGSFLDTTADKLLVTGVLIALVGADRVSTWIAAIIVGRELVILALRGMVAVDGEVMPPSIWGKLKTAIQFVAIPLAILRPGDPFGGMYLDEWVMLVAAFITVMSAVEYLQRFSSALTGHD